MAKKSAATTTGAAAATKLAVAAAAAGTQAKARSQASDLGDRLAPVVDDAKERLVDLTGTVATRIDDFTDTVSNRLEDLSGTVTTRFDDLSGTVATRLDDALPDRVTPAAVSRRAAVANRPNRLLQVLLVLGLGTVAAVITRRLTGGSSQPTWQAATDSRTPAGAPAVNATVSTPQASASLAGAATAGESTHGLIAGNDHASGNVSGSASNTAGETGPTTATPVETSADVAGGTPEEVAADATDTPHPVTTTDQPANKVILD